LSSIWNSLILRTYKSGINLRNLKKNGESLYHTSYSNADFDWDGDGNIDPIFYNSAGFRTAFNVTAFSNALKAIQQINSSTSTIVGKVNKLLPPR
jgi:hypothetical protein